jgi:hypothetical protein
MADLATLQTRLLEAELAYHKLLTGSAEEEVEHGDMRVRYTNSVTAMTTLTGYIEDLKSQIAALGGATTGTRRQAISVDLPG